MLTISAQTLEYVRVSVATTVNGSEIDPTGDAVQMAFVPQGTAPLVGDWKPATWETDSTQSPVIHYARALVGAGGVVILAASLYDCWLKIIDAPESPVKKSGPVRVI